MKVYAVFYYPMFTTLPSKLEVICSTKAKAENYISDQAQPDYYHIKEYTLDTYTTLVKQEVKI